MCDPLQPSRTMALGIHRKLELRLCMENLRIFKVGSGLKSLTHTVAAKQRSCKG